MPARVSPPLSFAVACLGIAIFSAMDATVKLLTLQSGVYAALLWRSVAGVAIGGTIHFARRPALPTPSALRLHVQRGSIVAMMVLLFFWGLARVPMAQAIALCFIAPLLALVLAAGVLKEAIGPRTWVASAVAFLGVLIVVAGQAGAHAGPEAMEGTLAILAGALCYAYNLILMRRQGAHSDAIEVAFFQNLIVGAWLLLALPWLGQWPVRSQLPLIAAAAAFATVSNILLAWAYARAPASRMASSEYTGFIWASLFGWAVFGEAVRPVTVAGAALIIVGCLIAARAGPPRTMEQELAA